MAISLVAHQPIPHVERPMADPPRLQLARRRRSAAGPGGNEDSLMGVALLAGPANVIMELAMPGVGYGVLESRVESGRLDRHPIKRARTTFTYVAVAVAGSDDQKAAFRRAVNKVHAQVYSTPESPVSYHAFDPELQLWVAACLYKGGVDVYRTFVGEMDDEEADHHYRAGMAMGTTSILSIMRTTVSISDELLSIYGIICGEQLMPSTPRVVAGLPAMASR